MNISGTSYAFGEMLNTNSIVIDDNPRKKISNLNRKVDQQRESIKDLRTREQKILTQMKKLAEDLSEAKETIKFLESQLANTNLEISKLKSQQEQTPTKPKTRRKSKLNDATTTPDSSEPTS